MEVGLILWGILVVFGLVYFLSPLIIMSRVGKLNRQAEEIIRELRRLSPPDKKPAAAAPIAPVTLAPRETIQTLNLKS